MLKNYFAIAVRNLRLNPLFATINMLSLAIGLAACMAIYLFIQDERSFDSFHAKGAQIYRLDEVQNFTGTNVQKVALSMPGMAVNMAAEFSDVKNFVRSWSHGQTLLAKGDKKILVDRLKIVDSTFFDLFDFPLLAGDAQTGLDEPHTVMLTEETALKFFPSVESAVGNTISVALEEFKITGVLKDVPENSHIQFDVLLSMTTFTTRDPEMNNRWGSNYLSTYLLLEPGADIKQLESSFPEFMLRHTGDPEINTRYTLFLQPFLDVHLGSTDIEHDYNNYRKFNGEYLEVFLIVGVFILLIASVNFMNLTTSRASHRWKEIGVRKTVGAKKRQLFVQFIFESTLMAVIALFVAVMIVLAFLPLINHVIDRRLSLTSLLYDPRSLLLLGVITLGLGATTGIYPAIYMSSFSLSRVFKGGVTAGKSVFRSSLVVVQFGLALAMIVSTLIIMQQLNFMKDKDIGFSTDQILLVSMNGEANEKLETIKQELLRDRHISGITAATQRLGNNFHQSGFKVKADTAVMELVPSYVVVDFDYLKVYGIRLKEGRDFSKEVLTDDGKAFIVNESLARELHLKETVGTPAGHSYFHNDSLGTIIGVAEDFNFNSLHHKINTLALVVHTDWGFDEMSVKVDGDDVEASIAAVKKVWDELVPSFPFSYSFLDDHFAALYRSDKQMSAVVTIMAGLAILIACMGLFGLAAITTEKKTKEIGIRKVLGATEMQITLLLSRNFAALIVLAFVIATPATYWLLNSWLREFAFRIEINLMLFLLGGAIALAIAMSTISFHTIRSARRNPAKALRYE
ncbi:MAG TPA: ABC transporter permease [Chryseolinea sp.]|nr:ABC transporter permease [Chryseolinea sp.]